LPQPKQIMSTHSDLGLNVSQSLKEKKSSRWIRWVCIAFG
jgi:hypothetical protein